MAQLSISFVGFNTTKPPFDDAAVRKSFLLAADRERLIKEVFKERVESDLQVRYRLYQEVEEILRQDAAAIPLSFGREFVLIKPFIKGFVVNPQGLVDFRLVSFTSH